MGGVAAAGEHQADRDGENGVGHGDAQAVPGAGVVVGALDSVLDGEAGERCPASDELLDAVAGRERPG